MWWHRINKHLFDMQWVIVVLLFVNVVRRCDIWEVNIYCLFFSPLEEGKRHTFSWPPTYLGVLLNISGLKF